MGLLVIASTARYVQVEPAIGWNSHVEWANFTAPGRGEHIQYFNIVLRGLSLEHGDCRFVCAVRIGGIGIDLSTMPGHIGSVECGCLEEGLVRTLTQECRRKVLEV